MLLNQFFTPKKTIVEGGNLTSQSPGWQGTPGDHAAQEIDLKLHNRDFMVDQIRALLQAQNENFAAQYGRPIWDPKLLDSNKMFSGSSLQFFDVKSVSTDDFLNKLKKTKVGDIDTQVDQNIAADVEAWLKSVLGKRIGNGTFVGFNSSLSSLWQLDEPPVKIQIDYELGPYDTKTNAPTEWFAYSHSSDYEDMAQGIKGVFHKYINRALTHSVATTKYVARVLQKSTKISPEPITDSDLSFAVAGGQGGGLSQKYKPYIDPQTGEPMEIDGIPVMQLLEPKNRDYIQNLDLQFQMIYGSKRSAQDKKLQNSFVGTMELMNKNFTPEQNEAVARSYLEILFAPQAQMITADDPIRDRDTKFASLDYMFEHLNLPDAHGLRQEAVQMAMDYEAKFNAKRAAKPSKRPVAEAEEQPAVKAQFRKGMPHLNALKPADFLDLLDEIHDGNGNFKLENIPLNVKVDGFGGRFGKNAEGRPFMATSRTEPRYEAGFEKYNIEKAKKAGVAPDPERLEFSRRFDKLFDEMMQAVSMVDSALGADFLVNKQVTCEVLFMPFAIPQEDGRLKFVGIAYDALPKGVELALVPFRVVDAQTGEDLPDTQKIVDALTGLGRQGSVMFVNNRLVQNDALDVTALLPPLENIEEIKALFSGVAGKRDKASLEIRRQIEAQLQPLKEKLEQAIIQDPNIIGKDMLGKDYEGIVINSRLGPIKITSQEQRDVIQSKKDAMANARTERPRGEAKTAVVAIGSFVGHVGHEQLFDYTIKKAQSVGGDPYLFIGNAQGKDDPIPPDVKVQTWHKMYPQYAKNISTVTQQGGTLMQKIKHELINPLPGKPPRYDNVIIMVGEDQANMPIAGALMKSVNKFAGYEHVKVSLEVTPRGTGMSFTKLRNILKDPNATQEQQLAVWEQGFDAKKLGRDWILHLMDLTRKGMGIQQMPQQPKQPSLAETRVLNALIMPELNETARMSNAAKLQRAWEREQEKSAADSKRSREYMDKLKAAEPKKDDKKSVAEGEGDPEGLPHLTKELLTHIVQQVGTEGAHAIVKSLKWGDGAAKELLHLIVKDLKNNISMAESVKQRLDPKCWKGKHKEGTKIKGGVRVNNCVPNESVEEDWNKVNHHDKTDGLSQKAVNAYRRENPGSKLKTAVTTKPSKLKAGSKDAKRRKSFCARMSGNKGPMKDEHGKPTPKAKALNRWNCNESILEELLESTEMISKAEAHYIDRATSKAHCSGCTMFQSPNGCSLVKGTISPRGVCEHYESKSLKEFAGSPRDFGGDDDGETPGSWDDFINAFDPEIKKMGFGMDKRSSHDARIYAHPEAEKGIMVRQHPERDNVYYKLFHFFNKGEDEVGLADLSQNGAASVLVKVEDFLSSDQGVAEGLSKQFEIIYQEQNGDRKRKIVSGTSKEAVARQFKKQYKLEIEQVKQLQQGVAEGLSDTQRKIEDTINQLEDRLKHAKTPEQWDRIKDRIERLQAGLKRSKQGVAEGVSRRGFLKGAGAAALGAAAGDASAIAGAFPSPSTRAKWAADAAASNKAMAAQEVERQRQANAARAAKLDRDTKDVERLNKVSYHGKDAPKPSNAEWDGDSDFMDIDGTQYSMASRMPISGDEPSDMKLIVTREGRQVYIWTRYRMKGDGGHYFYPAANPKTFKEARANTKAVRTGLAKREKRTDPTMDAKKKSEQDAAWERLQAHINKPENMTVMKRLATKEGVAEGWSKLPSGDYQNSHTGVRTSKPPVKKKRGEKTGAEWDAIAKAKQNKEQGVAEAMLPKSAFAGSKKNKLGSAGQWKNTGPSKNRPARAGDLVGGAAEGVVPVREDVEKIMGSLIEQLRNK